MRRYLKVLTGALAAGVLSAGVLAERVPQRLNDATTALAAFVPQRGGGGGGGAQSLPVSPMRFRYMGPATGGRIASVVGIPGDPTTYYLGSASGGVWKSTDGGQSFAPIFDDQPVAAIGALA